jgi:TMEM175 potassium channel family protein
MKKPRSQSQKPEGGVQGATDHDQLGLERLIFFSDAVFAIAITLLALEIRLPAGGEDLSEAQLLAQLTGMWQRYLAYAISFLVIGVFWMAHHRKFRFIKRYNSALMMLNLLVLMVIAFVPFPSSVISEYPDRTATIFYALTMMLAALLMAVLWWYASRHNRLVDPRLDAKQRRRQMTAPLVTTLIFLLSIGIAFFNADAAKFFWILILPATLYSNRN